MRTAGTERAASGRFVLRIDPNLHANLRQAARAMRLSLNEYCARKLATPGVDLAGWELASDAVQHAAAVAGSGLEGVVVFGSWARAELHDASDIDLLVVVEPSLDLSRRLYTAWDQTPARWQGHRLEPHFVQLPQPDRVLAGLWAEVAIDGIVVFSRSPALPMVLAGVRRNIAAGRIVRRFVHGQPYWVEAA